MARVGRYEGTGGPKRLLLGLLIAVPACAGRPVRLVTVTSSMAETVSLLGDTLYSLRLGGAAGPERIRNLSAARDALSRDSSDLNARLRLARSIADLGRLREAVRLYNTIAESHFNEPRVFRERGEVLLRLRHLDQAIDDLRRAGLLVIGRAPILEAGSLIDDLEQSAPPSWATLTTVQFGVFFYQGVALYCRAEYRAAYPVLAEAVRIAPTTDDRARAMLWLFFAARRIDDGAEGARVLELVTPEWAERSEVAELGLLFGFKGIIPTDSIRRWARLPEHASGPLYSYGLGYFLLLRPDRRADAELWLEQARRGGNWAALPYLAAEADLARLRGTARIIR